MDTATIEQLLKDLPLFSTFSESERARIKKKSAVAHFQKNDLIYKEGDPPDAFYCVVEGRAMVYTQDSLGHETVLEFLHRGKYFGIISLLTGEAHSVTARAVNDCVLLVIKKDDFAELLLNVPRLAIDLGQTLSRRLKRRDVHQKTIFESTIVAVFSSYSQAGKSIYALNLALSLLKETHKSVLLFDIATKEHTHSLPRRLNISSEYPTFDLCVAAEHSKAARELVSKNQFGVDLLCVYYDPENESCIRNLVDVITLLVNDYHYLILDLPSVMDRSILKMLNQADLIHLLSSPQPVDLEKTHKLTQRLISEFGFPETKIKVVVNEYKLSKLRNHEQSELVGATIFATLPRIGLGKPDKLVVFDPECEYSMAIRRISRQLGDCLVGLALGVGAAYGFCHIGVLRVIEEEKIPIDVIAGSSIGALIASLWATGRSSDEILEITREFREPKFIWSMVDLTIPTLGFIKGKKLYKFLRRHLGDKTFHDVRLPLKVIASDVKRKETRVLDKGLLVDAIMASCSMPGVFMPFRFSDDILFDGGVISPLPTEPLVRMGIKKIIAVNVTPSRDDVAKQYARIQEVIAEGKPFKSRWFSLRKYFKDKFKANILDYIFSSFEMLQSAVAQKEGLLADIVLHPDTHGLYWLELNKAREFAKRGEEEARKHLDKIWQVINE